MFNACKAATTAAKVIVNHYWDGAVSRAMNTVYMQIDTKTQKLALQVLVRTDFDSMLHGLSIHTHAGHD